MALHVWFWLLLLSVLWGGSFFLAKVAVAELGPLTVVFARVALAAVALNLALAAMGRGLSRSGTPWRAYLAMGLLNNVLPFGLIFWGQRRIPSGLASILNATTPLFALVIAHHLTADERIDGIKVVALLAGLAGVAVLVGPDALLADAGLWGQIACLGGALSYAFAGVYGRRFRAMGIAPLDAAAGQVMAGAVLILPIMLMIERPWTLSSVPSPAVLAALAGLALLSTALAYVLYFRILAAAGATNLLLVTFLIPVTAILLGSRILGEQRQVRQFAGLALIAVGLALVDGRIVRRRRPAK